MSRWRGGEDTTMIIQLQLEDRFRFTDRRLKRIVKNSRLRARRYVKAQIRKARSRSLAWYRAQYFLGSAFHDMRIGIRKNEDIFISILLIAIIIGFSFAVLASEIFYVFFVTTYILAESSGINMLLMSLFATGALVVSLGWVAAWIVNMMAMSVWQGVQPTKNRSARSTIRNGLKLAPMTTLAWLAVIVRAGAPICTVLLASFMAGIFGLVGSVESFVVVGVAVCIGLIVSVRELLRCSLLPYVMLFERPVDHTSALIRSNQLVERRGKVFLLTGYLFLTALLAAEFGVALMLEKVLNTNKEILFALTAIATLLLANNIIVAFYRKRRLSRTTR